MLTLFLAAITGVVIIGWIIVFYKLYARRARIIPLWPRNHAGASNTEVKIPPSRRKSSELKPLSATATKRGGMSTNEPSLSEPFNSLWSP